MSPLLGEIIARHGESLLRLKGVIRTADDIERRLATKRFGKLFITAESPRAQSGEGN